jgi:hypothetical protein
LEAIDDDHDFVIDIFTIAAQVFELQCCPADDVRLAKFCGVLQQERINIFVIGVGFTLFDEFGAFAGGDMGEFVSRLLTVVSSLNLQERNILDFLAESILAARSGQIPPSLLP